jgi:hypothetical protein
MSYTRRQFITGALEEIGIATYAFDIPPERLETAMRRLDAMIAAWNAKGIRLGYPIPSNPGSGGLDDETNVPDRANQAIITNLAVIIAPSWGKSVMPATQLAAKQGYDLLCIEAAQPIEIQPNITIYGAGGRYRDVFTAPPQARLSTGTDELELT